MITDYTFESFLEVLLARLPRALLDKAAYPQLDASARLLAGVIRGGFECRLTSDKRVDLHQNIRPQLDAIPMLIKQFRHHSQSAAWLALSDFMQTISNPQSLLHQQIEDVWLELDSTQAGPQPMLFFLSSSIAEQTCADNLSLLYLALNIMNGRDLSQRTQTKIAQCFEIAAGFSAKVQHIGLRQTPDGPLVRLNFKMRQAAQMQALIKALGLETLMEPRAFQSWKDLNEANVTLCLDLNQQLFPRLGFELFWDEPVSQNMKLERFLHQLVKQDLCHPDKAEALFAWLGWLTPQNSQSAWPDPLIIESLRRPERFSAIKCSLNHIKLSFTPNNKPEAKAYLRFAHHWLKD